MPISDSKRSSIVQPLNREKRAFYRSMRNLSNPKTARPRPRVRADPWRGLKRVRNGRKDRSQWNRETESATATNNNLYTQMLTRHSQERRGAVDTQGRNVTVILITPVLWGNIVTVCCNSGCHLAGWVLLWRYVMDMISINKYLFQVKQSGLKWPASSNWWKTYLEWILFSEKETYLQNEKQNSIWVSIWLACLMLPRYSINFKRASPAVTWANLLK